MKLDLSKLGYRWKGDINYLESYEVGDTVRMGNDIVSWDGNGWVKRASGQTNAEVYGAIPVAGTQHQTMGIDNQVLHVNGLLEPEFQFSDGRSSTAVAKLAKTGFDRASNAGSMMQNMGAIMTDGSVRTWGEGNYYALGGGAVTSNRTMPTVVPFPAGTPPIVELRMGNLTNYAIDVNGQLWVWGYNTSSQGNAGVGPGLSHIPVPQKLNGLGDLGEYDYVVDVWTTSTDYTAGAYQCSMCRTADGRVFAWGYNAYGILGTGTGNTYELYPTIVPISLTNPIVDLYLYNTAEASYGVGGASYLIDTNGAVWMAGYSTFTHRMGDNATTQTHKCWAPSLSDPVKKVSISLQCGDPTITTLYRNLVITILTHNGNLYTGGYWPRTSYVSTATMFGPNYNSTGTIRLDPRISDVKDVVCYGGAYGGITAVKNDGTVWAVGHVWGVNPANNTDTNYSYTDWTEQTYWGNDNIKIAAVAYNTTYTETTTRGLFLQSTNGLKGIGTNAYITIGTGDTKPVSDRNVPFNLPIEDWQISGYQSPACSYILSGGNVYSTGAYIGLGNEDDADYRTTFSPVIF